MSPTMRRASGRSTRSSTSWSSSRMATRVSRGFALIRISRFIGNRRLASAWRLGTRTGAVSERRGGGTPERERAPDGRNVTGDPPLERDRPRRTRLPDLTRGSQRTIAWTQRTTDRIPRASVRSASKRKPCTARGTICADGGRCCFGRRCAWRASTAPRVAQRERGGKSTRVVSPLELLQPTVRFRKSGNDLRVVSPSSP